MVEKYANPITGGGHTVRSEDGTLIEFLSFGAGPAVIVIPGVLSMARDYTAFAQALGEHFTVHVMERRGRGQSGPQGFDYSIAKECQDVVALSEQTGASLLVGHSYGGLVALEVARDRPIFTKVAVYEPGISINGSMPTDWMPGYERNLRAGKRLDAFVDFTRADAPPRIRRLPRWLLKMTVLALVILSQQYRQMLGLLETNLHEWREIGRLDSSYENYREVPSSVLLMYGGRSDSHAVDLIAERLPKVVPHLQTRPFPELDHFGIEKTAPTKVARVVADYFLT